MTLQFRQELDSNFKHIHKLISNRKKMNKISFFFKYESQLQEHEKLHLNLKNEMNRLTSGYFYFIFH